MIEKYIQFAIDNGYTGYSIQGGGFEVSEPYMEDGYILGDFIKSDNCSNYYPVYEIITSKPFIEAVARGLMEEELGEIINITVPHNKDIFKELLDEITTQQAIAIRDNKLEEFIKTLLVK